MLNETEVIITMFIAGLFGGFIGAVIAIALFMRIRDRLGGV